MSRKAGANIRRVLMVNIKTGRIMEAWGIPAAARMMHINTYQVEKYIRTGDADPNGWTYDIGTEDEYENET